MASGEVRAAARRLEREFSASVGRQNGSLPEGLRVRHGVSSGNVFPRLDESSPSGLQAGGDIELRQTEIDHGGSPGATRGQAGSSAHLTC